MFAALFIAAALLFANSLYLCAAGLLALLINASAVYSLPSKTAPCPSLCPGSGFAAQLANALLAAAILAGGALPAPAAAAPSVLSCH